MNKEDYNKIAMEIWRSGVIPDKNKLRQTAKEQRTKLIVTNLVSMFAYNDPNFNKKDFIKRCGINNI